MKAHLKPLFIKAKVEGKIIKRVLVDGGAAVNLIPEHVVKKLGKTCSDVMPHNMVITDFNGKNSSSPGCIVLDLQIGSATRPTMFVVVPSKANYNLLLGREWIHGVGAVPSTLHQLMFLWNNEGQLETIKGDDSYFQCEVNNADFEKNLSHIQPLMLSNKEEFYNKNPAHLHLSQDQWIVSRTCGYCNQETHQHGPSQNWDDNSSEFSPISFCPGLVFEYDWSKNPEAATLTLPLPREFVSYPDIQPTGWDEDQL